MSPVNTIDYQADVWPGHVKQIGDGLVCQSSSIMQCPNGNDVSFREDGLVVFAAAKPRSVPDLICSVFGSRGPAKVTRAIIEGVPVVVRHFVPVGGLGTIKCRAYKRMNQLMGEFLAAVGTGKIDEKIWRCPPRRRFQYLAPVANGFTGLGKHHAIYRANVPKIGRLIRGITRDRLPLFHDLQDNNDSLSLQVGITLLAART